MHIALINVFKSYGQLQSELAAILKRNKKSRFTVLTDCPELRHSVQLDRDEWGQVSIITALVIKNFPIPMFVLKGYMWTCLLNYVM